MSLPLICGGSASLACAAIRDGVANTAGAEATQLGTSLNLNTSAGQRLKCISRWIADPYAHNLNDYSNDDLV